MGWEQPAGSKNPVYATYPLRQVWDGGLDRRGMYFATVAWLISIPSLSSSPWILGAPHKTLARAILRTNSRISTGTEGPPGRIRWLFCDQNRRNRWRCQSTTVSGRTRWR